VPDLPIIQTVADDLTEVESGLIDYLTDVTRELMRQQHVPGLSVCIRRTGRLVWDAGFGYADLAEQRPMTPDTVFRSGSMGKTYTAIGVMKLVEHGRLALDQPINDVLDFRVDNPLGERDVTVEDLLTHRSGLASNGAGSTMEPPPPLNDHLREHFTAGIHELWRGSVYDGLFTQPVGEAMQYSNSGLGLLGLMIERANGDGLSYAGFLRKYLIEPLGHTWTFYPDGVYDDPAQVPQEIQDRVSTGYTGFGTLNIRTPKIYFKDFPAGLILSIGREHARILQLMMNGGELDGLRILEEQTVADMLTPRVPFAPPRPGGPQIGLRWMLGDPGQTTEWIGHGGAHMYGWHNDYRGYPKLDLAMSVNTNRWDLAQTSQAQMKPHLATLLMVLAARYVAAREVAGRDWTTRPWAWKRSYVLGLVTRACVNGSLGITQDLDDTRVKEMLTDVNPGDDGLWDPDGYQAGVRSLDGNDFSAASVEAFLGSDDCPVDRAELEALWGDCGGIGAFPLPIAPAIRAMLATRTLPG